MHFNTQFNYSNILLLSSNLIYHFIFIFKNLKFKYDILIVLVILLLGTQRAEVLWNYSGFDFLWK